MDRVHFFERLYPLQDEVLGVLRDARFVRLEVTSGETILKVEILADLRRPGEELALLPAPR